MYFNQFLRAVRLFSDLFGTWSNCLISMWTRWLLDSSPEMLPSCYFVSTGSCFQRCPKWLFSSLLEDSNVFVLDCARQSLLRLLLQRCYRLVISSLLDLVSRDVPSGYFVSAGGFRCICAWLCTTVSLKTSFSRDVTGWLFHLYWILFPEISQVDFSSLLEDSNIFVLSSCTTVSL